MRSFIILNVDAFDFLECIEDSPGTAIDCDPPYLVKGAKYVHDCGEADHQRLAETLLRFKRTRVVVSYYDHPRLATLYPKWTIGRIDFTKAIANQAKRDDKGATKATECLLINTPPNHRSDRLFH